MQRRIQELTHEAFAPYGTVIEQPPAPSEASGTGWQWWSEAAVLPKGDRPYAVGYLALEPGPTRFDWAEYHRESQEAIIPLGHECLIYVGEPGQEPDWERFEVFRVRPGQGVMLREGVWHGAPLAIDQPLAALVLLQQGTGARDVYKATRAEGPVDIVDMS